MCSSFYLGHRFEVKRVSGVNDELDDSILGRIEIEKRDCDIILQINRRFFDWRFKRVLPGPSGVQCFVLVEDEHVFALDVPALTQNGVIVAVHYLFFVFDADTPYCDRIFLPVPNLKVD